MRFLWRSARLLVILGLILFLGLRGMPKPKLLDGVHFSPAIYDRNGELMRLGLAADEVYREFVPLKKIAPQLQEATLLYEDRYYYSHCGINPIALLRGITHEFGSGRRLGASTISMQVARMRFRLNTRSYTGKLRQMALALKMEASYSKREILEAYLNLAPYGRNIEGVGAAARVYFGKEAVDLTLSEAITLSVIPQNPSRRAPSAKDPKALQQARTGLFEEWILKHPADAEKRERFEMPLQIQSLATLPFRAPHVTEELIQSRAQPRGRLVTTLDLRLQTALEKNMDSYLVEKSRQGISNACALLVHYPSMEVIASVGSANFWDPKILGQVNGASMKRSPGSALKPFIYGLAMEQGIIQPHTLLKDEPVSFNGYNPENFDRDFMGPVQANEALLQSRNVPAVYLASRLVPHSLYELLEKSGVSEMKPESVYGLSIALGGIEVSPEELVRLYAMLANRGKWQSLVKIRVEKSTEEKQVLSPEAAFLVLDMLKRNSVRERSDSERSGSVAWKTGTSYSFRDAWCVGVFDEYVLAVWVGNFDAKPNPAFVGRSAATPLFQKLTNAVRSIQPSSQRVALWESRTGLKLAEIDLCSVCGSLPTKNCHELQKGFFIPGVSPIETCAIHQEISIDTRTGDRVTDDTSNPFVRREIWEVWPSDLQKLFAHAGLARRPLPDFASEKMRPASSFRASPKIISPCEGLEYHLRLNEVNSQIPLQAATEGSTKEIYWFAGKSYLGRSAVGETFFWEAAPGVHAITAVDESGLTASRRVVVMNRE